jgi:hypothetical protein
MQLVLQTAFTPPGVVYDSDVPSTGQGWIQSIVNPVVAVQQSGVTLYSTGSFYPDNSTENILLAMGILFGIGYGAYKLLR